MQIIAVVCSHLEGVTLTMTPAPPSLSPASDVVSYVNTSLIYLATDFKWGGKLRKTKYFPVRHQLSITTGRARLTDAENKRSTKPETFSD